LIIIQDLGRQNTDLNGITLLQGIGLTSNVYLILGAHPGLVDAGSGPPENQLRSMIEKAGVNPKSLKTLILTHNHHDHSGGLDELKGLDIQVIAHPSITTTISKDFETRPVMDNETVRIGHLSLKIFYTPGHTRDDLCLYNHPYQILFSGDTVFPRGNFGRTDLPGGDPSKLLVSIRRLRNLEVRHLLPGHENPIIGNGNKHLSASLEAALEYLTL
jgi:glyoxylase-like metal-dependent hydrolase (beta-lactamase superfamily II)